MLRYRLLVGPILILGLLAGFWLDALVDGVPLPGWLAEASGRETWPRGTVLLAMAIPISVLAARELAYLLKAKGLVASRFVMTISAIAGLGVSCFVPAGAGGVQAVAVSSTAAMAVLVGSVAYYSRRQSLEGVVAGAGGALLAFVYLGLMFGFVLAIRREHSIWLLLWVLLTTKACDVGAYFTGRFLGRHKLIQWLSPKKTWEGLYGGIAFAALIGWLGTLALGLWAGEVAPGPVVAAFLGGLFGLVGQMGDLFASALKRDAGAKDSGQTLPGFGGVIDVLDSPLLVAPVAYWMLALAIPVG
ncbi:MAG: phosphatidate cytidylyltransferase [Planctomycetota bacterium]